MGEQQSGLRRRVKVYLVLNGSARVEIAGASVYDQASTLAELREKLTTIYADENVVGAECDDVEGEFVNLRLLTDEELAA